VATNAQVAEKLGVSHSTVSRMRTGKRIGSPEVLSRISSEFEIPLADVMNAAVKARNGKLTLWTRMMKKVLGD